MEGNRVALMVGGPKHGERIAVQGGMSRLHYVAGSVDWARCAGDFLPNAPLDIQRYDCRIERLYVGDHVRKVVIAPGVSLKTAESYFYDVLVDAYDRHARKL